MGEPHDTRTVRAHYAELAATYDDQANRACNRAYETLIRQTLAGCTRVLELGAGSSPRAGLLAAERTLACDLSWPMLAARRAFPALPRLVADGQCLPLAEASFDGAFSINVLEHVPDPTAFIAEAARVLSPGGRLLALTPNGDLTWLLDTLEWLRLKLPEGPHKFLSTSEMRTLGTGPFTLVEHRTCLAFPAGPEGLVRGVDRVARSAGIPGLFQYALWQRV